MRSRNEIRKNTPDSYGYKWHTQILFTVLFARELVFYVSHYLGVDYESNAGVKDFLTTIPLF